MNILDIITRKKNNQSLSYDELSFAFNGYLNGSIPDYQMSALLMAIVINGMNMTETLALTDIFLKSGDELNLGEKIENLVDKHSTGGIGDTTTLIIGPMCASLGMKMAKMSGRGLGITGGTIDKLESIPGFNVNLSEEEFISQVENIGFAVVSQTKNLTPLDKVIYALRDVTGTAESIPLIASSIMSKKLALGSKNILIDVKVGKGALMKTIDDANTLCKYLEEIGDAYNRSVRTIIGNMDAPLSYAIGNSLEVCEAMNVLNGKRCPLYDACVEIVANLYDMTFSSGLEEGYKQARYVLESKKALNKFYEFVHAQGGSLRGVSVAKNKIKITASETGEVEKIDALKVGELAATLGASKKSLDDKIDYTVGIMLNVKIGDHVNTGDTLYTIYTNEENLNLSKNDTDFITISSGLDN
mgnify:FL=1